MNRIKFDYSLIGKIRLDLGCGSPDKQRPNHNVRLDYQDYGQEIVWDVRNGIPLPDDSCEYITASHFLEHFYEDDFIKIMNECWRVLKEDGELYVICPSFYRDKSWIPIHKLHPTEETFRFFEFDYYKDSKDCPIKPWKITKLVINDKQDIHVKMQPKKN